MLVALLVTAVLSMTSIIFLVLGDTEVRLSQSDLDESQPIYIAEGVVRVGRSWFDDSDPDSNPLVPALEEVELSHRRCDLDGDGLDDPACDGSGDGPYLGGDASGRRLLFDRPWRGDPRHTFLGRREAPDVLIQEDRAGSYLDRLNRLFASGPDPNIDGVRIAEIRIYGPPTDHDLGARRRGIATLEVTVEKRRQGRRVARRTVQAILAEIPWPRAQGGLEAGGTISWGGSFEAHWGGIVAEADIHLPPSGSRGFPDSAFPRKSFQTAWHHDFNVGAPDRTPDDGSVERAGVQNLLSELLGLSVEGLRPSDRRGGPAQQTPRLQDPWLRLAAAGSLFEGGHEHTSGQPWPWEWEPGDMPNLLRQEDRSNLFAGAPVAATPVRYGLWKSIAQGGGRGLSYLAYAGLDDGGEPLFRKDGSGPALPATVWTNSELSGGVPGLFFFDTVDGADPVEAGGRLTPPIRLDRSHLPGGSKYLARGFLYANAASVGSRGMGGTGVPLEAAMPGEPFLDAGIDLDGSGFVGNTETERELMRNGRWDCDCDGDGDVDDDDARVPFVSHDDLYVDGRPDGGVDPRFARDDAPGHQRHEPFLNLDYPAPLDRDFETRVDFAAEGDATGAMGATTRGRDAVGGLYALRVHLDGMLYNEGDWDGSGNLSVHGAILVGGDANLTGNPEIWFDDRMARGEWPDRATGLPRVVVTALLDAHAR